MTCRQRTTSTDRPLFAAVPATPARDRGTQTDNSGGRTGPETPPPGKAVAFDSAEEAWFWFMQCHEARLAGARVRAGVGLVPRPCEPLDVIRVVDRLYRQRRLLSDHIRVLAHYGRRAMAPEPDRSTEQRAAVIWAEAFERIAPALRRKGILADPPPSTDPQSAAPQRTRWTEGWTEDRAASQLDSPVEVGAPA